MQTAASNSLVLTNTSSFERIASYCQKQIGYGGFYKQLASGLARGVYQEHIFGELGKMLVEMAEQAYAFRRMDVVEQLSRDLIHFPVSRQHKAIGRYYLALCIQRFGRGDIAKAVELFEQARASAPATYTLRSIISLGTSSRYQADNRAALAHYRDAIRYASTNKIHDAYVTLGTQKMFAVIQSEEGNHREALEVLENLFPFAGATRSVEPQLYYDYLNSLAVELCEAGRLEEARNVSQIVIASPFAFAYPEWRETRDAIELKGLRASRSTVGFGKVNPDSSLTESTGDASVKPAHLEGGNLVHLPIINRAERLLSAEAGTTTQPARVLSMQAWKDRIAKENADPHLRDNRPATNTERTARLGEMEALGTRGMLLRAMEMLGDECVTDDQLRKTLIILEGLESDETAGA